MIKGQNPKQSWCYRYDKIVYWTEVDPKTVMFGLMP